MNDILTELRIKKKLKIQIKNKKAFFLITLIHVYT